MSSMKTDLRNRVKSKTLDNLVRISMEGPIAVEFDFLQATNMWLGIGKKTNRVSVSIQFIQAISLAHSFIIFPLTLFWNFSIVTLIRCDM